jgi:hypothetical protein
MGAEHRIEKTNLPETATEVELTKKYYQLCDQASYESGHGGYTGTIAESSGMKVRSDLKFQTENDAYEHIDDFAEKWKEAVVVLVKNDKDGGYSFYFAGIYSC